MISKMNPDGSRIGILLNGLPLFKGDMEVVILKLENG